MLRFNFCAGLILILASQAHAESELFASKQAETLGFAIECGCLKYDEETVVRSLRYLFPAVRGQDRQTLADSVRKGRRKAIGHEEIFPACLMICNVIDWGPIHRTIQRGEVVTMLSERQRREVVSIYDDRTRTIFLPDGWTGETPEETSVLVQEMVPRLVQASDKRRGNVENHR